MIRQLQAAAAARAFQVDGQFLSAAPYGSGHINDTFCAVFERAGAPERFLLQRINTQIFLRPAVLMENIARVTSHIAGKLNGLSHRHRRVLSLISARDGSAWHQDEHGDCWRLYRFIEAARTFNTVTSPEQAYESARAFGQFQRLLIDLPAPQLADTIPDFHNTPLRYKAFEQALAEDTHGRTTSARPEIDFALAHQQIAGELLRAQLPGRVIHNDTKLNNVLFDDESGEALCVVDLDTVMPGLALYDFGDMVRTATSAADEDEQELSRVSMRFPMFEALLRGYLSEAAGFLTPAEINHLAASGKVITFEQGLRFLTDYLRGDTYYKVQRPNHNLDRCRAQFQLLQSIIEQQEDMNRLVDALVPERAS